MLADGIARVPLKTNIRIVTGGVTGYGVNETNVKPISSLSLTAGTIAPRKAVATIAISDELAKFATPAAERFFNAERKKALSPRPMANFSPGLPLAVSATASAGSSAANVLTDLATLSGRRYNRPKLAPVFHHRRQRHAKKLVTKTNSSGAVAFSRTWA